jgi:hypothetical protein
MNIHVLIEHGYTEFITLFSTKQKLFDFYIRNLKKDDSKHIEITLERFKSGKSELDHESIVEITRAFEGKPYDINAIDLSAFFENHDCDTQYYERKLL